MLISPDNIRKNRKKNGITGAAICFCLFYFVFWYLYKLAFLPGLHGDEAWFGLKATEFEDAGINQLHGMNNYTGILQPYLTSVVFHFFGRGVFQLRVITAVVNLLGIAILLIVFNPKKYSNSKILIAFFFIIGQSIFLLISARVAWEVNTFTLFFISLLLLSVKKMKVSNQEPIGNKAALLFLIVNLLGTYNHVIFSCISFSSLFGLALWSLHHKSLFYKNLLILGLINALNLFLLYFLMQNYIDVLISIYPYVMISIMIILFIELLLFRFLSIYVINKVQIKISPIITITLILSACCGFIYFHGLAFFKLITNYRVLQHFFSYESTFFQNTIYIIFGCAYLIILCWLIIQDIRNQHNSMFAWIILTYFGLFNFYTTNCSFRYYLSIFILTNMYIAIKINRKPKLMYVFFLIIGLSLILTNSILFEIFTHKKRFIKPTYFDMGNGKMETSAHFIPSEPLIECLKKNKIRQLNYGSNRYFIEQPVNFYYKINPWLVSTGVSANVDYNFQTYGNGYKIKFDTISP